MNGIYAAGILLLARWALATSLGRKALIDAPPRRNRMPAIMPLVPLAIWFLGAAMLQPIVYHLIGPRQDWQRLFLDNLIFCVAALFTVAVMLAIAKLTFARGLKGFGLRPRTIPRDLGFAFGTLLAVWPLVTGVVVLTITAGKVLLGPQFEMPQHMGLEIVTESTALPLQVLIVVLAVVVAPLVEEMLFRGFIQTAFRSYFGRPWLGILITAAMFAAIHVNFDELATITHVPALFALAVGLGYTYEKSGSLFRPIFMHALFNGLSILAAISERPPA